MWSIISTPNYMKKYKNTKTLNQVVIRFYNQK